MKKYIIGGIIVILAGAGFFLIFRNTQGTRITSSNKSTLSYVALGDSVAAGAGLPTASDSSACDRTDESYPNQLAHIKHYAVKNIACSGATYTAGIIGTQDVNKLIITSQIDQLFSLPRPNVITITAGANDVRWTENIAKCYTGTCGTDAQTATIGAQLQTLSQNLQTTLSMIRDHYAPPLPKVIVTGYYQVFPVSSMGCIDLVGISQEEMNWGRQQQANLNDTIQNKVSTFNFAHFAPLDFSGHELCTSTPWVQSLTDKMPYHPTASGQQAIAEQIAKLPALQ